MGLVVIGLNHESAPLQVREKVAYSKEEAVRVLKGLRPVVPQALLLSTCNRTELYAFLSDPEAIPRLKEELFLSRFSGNGAGNVLYVRRNEDAVEHLFRVACGLDSMVLGEQEILGQVKQAYEISRDAQTLGALFHRLAEAAVHVGKRARTETKIGHGPVSVAFAAVELAEKVFETLERRGVLLVGAGENGALCARHLLSHRASPLYIVNRTLERAEALAREFGGETVAWDGLRDALAEVDIAVSTTGAAHTVIGEDMVREVMRRRDGKALVLIDIAVPRDVEPGVDRIPNVFRFDIDTLQGVVEQSVARRRREVPAVERMVRSEAEGFMRWWDSLASGPVIRDLHQVFESVRIREVEKNQKRFRDEDRAHLDLFSRNLIRKVLMTASKELKDQKDGDPVAMERLAAIREIFGLDVKGDERGRDDSR